MNIVKVVKNTIVGTANTVGNIAAAVKQNPVKAAGLCFQLVRQVLGLLLGDEPGGLNAVDQKLQFLCFKFPLYNPPSSCPAIILGFIAVFIQKVEVRTDGFLLDGDFMVIVEMFNDFLKLYGVRFVCLFQQIVQQIKQF